MIRYSISVLIMTTILGSLQKSCLSDFYQRALLTESHLKDLLSVRLPFLPVDPLFPHRTLKR